MNKIEDYLTEEELNRLILQVETGDMAVPPPDLAEKVLDRLEAEEKRERVIVPEGNDKIVILNPQSIRKKEYRNYCIRVMTSVAAAVLLVFMIPQLLAFNTEGARLGSDLFVISRTETTAGDDVDVSEQENAEGSEDTETEKSGIFGKIGNTHYLSDNESHKIFKAN